MDTFWINNIEQNEPNSFYCKYCNYISCKISNYNRHILTAKHKKRSQMLILDTKNEPNEPVTKKFSCICGIKYKYSQGLSKHKNKCKFINNNNIKNTNDIINDKSDFIDKEMIMFILNQNNQLQQQIIELCKNGIQNINNNSINNSNNNSNNKSFNLNLFLNETCKNAMNIMDFANSIQINLSDLEKVGELGYVEGISKIIIDNLKLLDITERPVHCSDFKRDVLYVKDADKWEKENENNSKIKKAINSITNKNISLIPKWKKENPDCVFSNSIKSTKINKIIMEAMETDKSKQDKIIKNIAKEVIINKDL